jgi:hypothetical protein
MTPRSFFFNYYKDNWHLFDHKCHNVDPAMGDHDL